MSQLLALILQEIQAKGPMTFARYIQLALYAPGLGYYSNGLKKFGAAGDYITAPLVSPLFSHCIARQCEQVLRDLPGADILEIGGGTGAMALEILKMLEHKNCLPNQYYMLEVSRELQARQKTLFATQIPHLLSRIQWLSCLPTSFTGVIVANEVIDSMPVHKFKIENGIQEIYVNNKQGELTWCINKPSSAELINGINKLDIAFSENYESEINLLLSGWVRELANALQRGLILLIDYGFPRHEYYHPDRSMGTIMCHQRHQAHDNPLLLTGSQDITSHVDFTAIAEAALAADLQVSGYTSQAHFLLNCGLMDCASLDDAWEQYQLSQIIKRLTLPSEMGELFKAIALTKNYDTPLLGFLKHNQTERLSCPV